MTSLAELETAFVRCREQELTCFVSFYSKKVGVTLTKYAYTGGNNTEFQVKGEGDSVAEAFDMAFNNFPKSPLDGASKWKSDRLAAPEKVEEATFTDIKDTL
jgi:hypothetical protein